MGVSANTGVGSDKTQHACMHVCVCCEYAILVDRIFVHVNERASG